MGLTVSVTVRHITGDNHPSQTLDGRKTLKN